MPDNVWLCLQQLLTGPVYMQSLFSFVAPGSARLYGLSVMTLLFEPFTLKPEHFCYIDIAQFF